MLICNYFGHCCLMISCIQEFKHKRNSTVTSHSVFIGLSEHTNTLD